MLFFQKQDNKKAKTYAHIKIVQSIELCTIFALFCPFFALSEYLCTPSGQIKGHLAPFSAVRQFAENKFFDKLSILCGNA